MELYWEHLVTTFVFKMRTLFWEAITQITNSLSASSSTLKSQTGMNQMKEKGKFK